MPLACSVQLAQLGYSSLPHVVCTRALHLWPFYHMPSNLYWHSPCNCRSFWTVSLQILCSCGQVWDTPRLLTIFKFGTLTAMSTQLAVTYQWHASITLLDLQRISFFCQSINCQSPTTWRLSAFADSVPACASQQCWCEQNLKHVVSLLAQQKSLILVQHARHTGGSSVGMP